MTCHEYDIQIDDYVDGTLPGRAGGCRRGPSRHVQPLPRGRRRSPDAALDASTLERRTPPPAVWTRVAAAIHESPEQTGWLSWMLPGLAWRSAVAAAVMVAVLAAATWFSWREATGTRRVASVALTAPSAESAGVEQAMRTQISDMEQTVKGAAAVLPSETKAAYRQAGAVIDDAQNRRASEPRNEVAQQSLFELLQSKLTLLQDMVALINEMRKGNQEEAARIVSGIEQ